jgi:hypothetical protein
VDARPLTAVVAVSLFVSARSASLPMRHALALLQELVEMFGEAYRHETRVESELNGLLGERQSFDFALEEPKRERVHWP